MKSEKIQDPGAHRTMTQLTALREIFDLAIREVLGNKHALDRVLSNYWRNHRCYGSRDRRLFSESIFAFFRYYGWLRKLLQDAERMQLEAGTSEGIAGASVARMLLAAWAVENLKPEAAHAMLAEHFDLPEIPFPAADDLPESRRMRLAPYLDGRVPAWNELLPAWAETLLAEENQLDAFYRTLAVRSPLWLRVQGIAPERACQELTACGLTVQAHRNMKDALAVTAGSVNLYTLDLYRNGFLEVQDLASQAIAAVCAPGKRERWWDACAGAGGKTLALAERMNRTGKVVASDIRTYKLQDLKLRARRAGFPNVEPRPWDGSRVPPRRAANFDGVLIDAPCSCSGVWRRNPDGRWNTQESDIEKITEIQREVLEHASPAVRPGGVLVYATCSVFVKENQDVVNAFLACHPDFVLEAFDHPLNGERVSGMLGISGTSDNCDSMFAARMRRLKN